MRKAIAALSLLVVLMSSLTVSARILPRVTVGTAVARTVQLAETKAEAKAYDKAEKRCDRRDGDVVIERFETFSTPDGAFVLAESNLIYNCTTD